MASETRGVTRRTVVRSAAWSVPVIAAAAAVPMAAASTVETQCISAADAQFAFASAPVTPPLREEVVDGRPAYVYQQGQTYEMTSTMTITYTGALPAKISDLSFLVDGTNWLVWTLAGTPTVSSTRGNLALGGVVEVPVANPDDRRGATTITPVAVGNDAYVHPGDVITVTWNFLAHGPSSPIGPGGTGYAYTCGALSSCNGPTPNQPYASGAPAFYQYVL